MIFDELDHVDGQIGYEDLYKVSMCLDGLLSSKLQDRRFA